MQAHNISPQNISPQNVNINFFKSEGYDKIQSFLTVKEVDEITEFIDSLNLKPCETVFDENSTGKIKQIQYLNTYGKIFTDLIDKITPFAELYTGTKSLKVLNMQYFEKHSEISKPTRAHQDNAYFK